MLNLHQLDLLAKDLGHDTMKSAIKEHYITSAKSLEQCAETLDLSLHTLRKLMLLFDIAVRQGPKKKLSLSLTDLRKNTLGQIATRHGVSRATIWRLKQRLKAEAARGEGS